MIKLYVSSQIKKKMFVSLVFRIIGFVCISAGCGQRGSLLEADNSLRPYWTLEALVSMRLAGVIITSPRKPARCV